MGNAAQPAVDALTLALKDKEYFVQDAAAEALEQIKGAGEPKAKVGKKAPRRKSW
jgi:hypothetical protein